ncbi:hypothetical protein JHT19_08960 [Vibrio parahaemolyticus]|uniref:Uncharacterized protein n=2 Tax=Vibrionaceae TaxID=641 RepID=A0A7Z2MUW4_VIBPH|nr:hypothetical protein [Vibrio navarrensis]QHH11075.1 hypothetical protein EHC69_09705 [Vibrio parahaemolyticus]UJX10085.1 hypothetical protein JHT19_08960 [Vibrio parahaemolyticus]HAS6674346.1 hypothetical protein [Vibrio parahaemolyticus]HAS6680039.1 hypothetical protein [Vibrio parahaemolyticus]
MTLTEKQQAAIEIFNSRNNIRGLDLTLNDLETLRDRISFIIEELSNEQELKNVEAAIQALRLVNVEIPDELSNKKKALSGSKPNLATQRKKAPAARFKIGEQIFEERSQGKPSRELAAAIQNYNNENGTSLTKKDFKTDDAVEKVD